MKVNAKAPGKLVVSGEYAVLLGAPAVVFALNFPVSCCLHPQAAGATDWHFVSRGFEGESRHRLSDLMPGISLPRPAPGVAGKRTLEDPSNPNIPEPGDPARLCWHVLRSLARRLPRSALLTLPESLYIEIDSRACYRDGIKLGVGSSAAACCALTGALLTSLGCYSPAAAFQVALEAHQAFQNGRGSGLDIAASMQGGCIEFKRTDPGSLPLVKPLAMPDNVYMTLIWTGQSADTTTHISDFFNWYDGQRQAGNSKVVDRLLRHTAAVADAFSAQGQWIERLSHYIDALKALDAVARMGIYSPAHARLDALARDRAVVYKPCGAGGGDLGLALSRKRDSIRLFSNTVNKEGFTVLPLELEQHGLETAID